MSRKFREGWQPCRLEDHPELQIHMMDHNSEWSVKGNVEIGGQLLCKMPEAKAKARDEHFQNLAQSQMDSVDNTYMKEQDNRRKKKSKKFKKQEKRIMKLLENSKEVFVTIDHNTFRVLSNSFDS